MRRSSMVGWLSLGLLTLAAEGVVAQARPSRPTPGASSMALEAAPPEEPGYTIVRLPGGGYYRYRSDEKPDATSDLTAADEPGTVQIVPRVAPRTTPPATGAEARTSEAPPTPSGPERAPPPSEPDRRPHVDRMHPPSVQNAPCLKERQYLARRLLQLRGVYEVPLSASLDVLATTEVSFSPWVAFSIFGVVPPPVASGNQLVDALSYDFETQWRLDELVRCEEQAGVRTPVRGQLP